jgi:hypothetical protein
MASDFENSSTLAAVTEAFGTVFKGGVGAYATFDGVTRYSIAHELNAKLGSVEFFAKPFATEPLARAAAIADGATVGAVIAYVAAGNTASIDVAQLTSVTGEGASSYMTSYPSNQYLSGVVEVLEFGGELYACGVESPSSGFSTGNNRTNISSAVTVDGILSEIRVYVQTLNSGEFYLELFNGSATTYTRVLSIPLIANSGGVCVFKSGSDFDPIHVDSGLVVGLRSPDGGPRFSITSGGIYYFADGDTAGETTSFTQSGQTLQIQLKTFERVIDKESKLRREGDEPGKALDAILSQNWIFRSYQAPNETSEFVTTKNRTYVNSGSVGMSGLVRSIRANVKTIGDAELILIVAKKISHPAEYQEVLRRSLTVSSAGWNEWSVGSDFTAFFIDRDYHIGIYTGTSGPVLWTTTSGGAYYTTGDVDGAAFIGAGQNNPIEIQADIYSDVVARSNPWLGKKIFFIGDSITYQDLFPRSFLETTGMIEAGIDGVVGRLLQNMADDLVAGDLDGVDIVLCGTGVNNWHHSGTTKGSFNDAADANTFYGAIRNIVEKVYALNPSVLVIFWGPINSGQYAPGDPGYGDANTGGLTISDVTDAMRSAARAWGCPFFATQEICGLNALNLTEGMPDNLHPDQAYADFVGASIGRFVNGLTPWVRS